MFNEWESQSKIQSKDKMIKDVLKVKGYLRGRILKRDILSNEILSFHNCTSTTKSPSSNDTSSLITKDGNMKKTLQILKIKRKPRYEMIKIKKQKRHELGGV